MKFRVTMKDPDGVYESLRNAVDDSLQGVVGLKPDQAKVLARQQMELLEEVIRKWISGGDYLTVEIDTEANTCVVIRCGD